MVYFLLDSDVWEWLFHKTASHFSTLFFYVCQELGSEGDKGEASERTQTFSYTINKFWRSNLEHGGSS